MKGKQLLSLGLAVFILTTLVTMQGIKRGKITTDINDSEAASGLNLSLGINEEDLGKMCLSGSLMIGSRGITRSDEVLELQVGMSKIPIVVSEVPQSVEEKDLASEEGMKDITEVANESLENDKPETVDSTANISKDKPLVIIYHTHATESYQPASDGNFHIVEEKSTVREVGNILTAALQAKGIQVIHDKTLHDNPSYNQSYSRSLVTINNLLDKYPNADLVIDLHRDAAAYTGGTGKTVLINGETVAKYNLVVGNGNSNASTLKTLASQINAKAEELYPGFGGRIIEKAYKFNQHVSDRHILLEVGNNENNIKESDACAKYFADVVAAVLK